MKITYLLLGFGALLTLAGRPAADPDACRRRGQEAYEAGDYTAALRWLEQAAERTTDPGGVAFDQAAALYRLGRFREAELHYRRCLEDATGPREARAWYDLGTAVVRQGGTDLRRLREAIACFDRCLGHAEASDELKAAARHNRALAEALARQLASQAGSEPETSPEPSSRQPAEAPSRPTPAEPADSTSVSEPSRIEPEPSRQPGAEVPVATAHLQPGQGNLPPVPDTAELVSLPPEDALVYLRQAAERIRRERQEHRRGGPPPPQSVKDW